MKEEKSFFKLMQKVPGGLIIVPMLIGDSLQTHSYRKCWESEALHPECLRTERPVFWECFFY